MLTAHCQTLGVPPGSSADVARKAYRTLALRWHPDKHQDEDPESQADASAKFRAVQAAYEALCEGDRGLLSPMRCRDDIWKEEFDRRRQEREQRQRKWDLEREEKEEKLAVEEAERRRRVAEMDAAFESRLAASRLDRYHLGAEQMRGRRSTRCSSNRPKPRGRGTSCPMPRLSAQLHRAAEATVQHEASPPRRCPRSRPCSRLDQAPEEIPEEPSAGVRRRRESQQGSKEEDSKQRRRRWEEDQRSFNERLRRIAGVVGRWQPSTLCGWEAAEDDAATQPTPPE